MFSVVCALRDDENNCQPSTTNFARNIDWKSVSNELLTS